MRLTIQATNTRTHAKKSTTKNTKKQQLMKGIN